ncbi:hypothetical protein AB0D78_36830 [Streptomyces avermitilis]|uniref:hypothetical protein n=1 Tax=Streptomyces avermitilis TaxID=33903 RepID=UPI0033DE31EC
MRMPPGYASTAPKDEEGFDAALPVLTGQQRRWLINAIARTYGPHPWAKRLHV